MEIFGLGLELLMAFPGFFALLIVFIGAIILVECTRRK